MAGSISVKLIVTDSQMETDETTKSKVISKPVGGNGTVLFEEDFEAFPFRIF